MIVRRNGFIRLKRDLFLSKYWNRIKTFSEVEAILDLYLLTDNQDSEATISYRELSRRWNWPTTNVYRLLKDVSILGFVVDKGDGKIKISNEYGTQSGTPNGTQSGTPKMRVIKGLRYVGGTPNGTQSGTQSGTIPKRKDINEKEKFPPHPLYKEKENYKEKDVRIPPLTPPEGVHGDNDTVFLSKVYPNINFYFIDGELKHPFAVWLRYKHDELKFTYKTQSSLEICYRDLKAKSGGDNNIAMAIVEQSVANGWKGLFKIKQNYNGRQYQQQDDDERLARDAAQLIADIERKKMDGSYSDNLNPSF
ncbi:MAG: hypothetical protein J5510_08410 [Prevotella sp.]|nr:hypothetical protein [Prevotella sp.]